VDDRTLAGICIGPIVSASPSRTQPDRERCKKDPVTLGIRPKSDRKRCVGPIQAPSAIFVEARPTITHSIFRARSCLRMSKKMPAKAG
jgi:hypothetical protein